MKIIIKKIKYVSLLILLSVFFVIINYSKVSAEEGYSIGQIPFIQFFCLDEESMLQLVEADTTSVAESSLMATMLVQFGKCIAAPYPIRVEIVDIILDYKDYDDIKLQIIKGKIENVFVFAAVYVDEAKKVPFKNKNEKI